MRWHAQMGRARFDAPPGARRASVVSARDRAYGRWDRSRRNRGCNSGRADSADRGRINARPSEARSGTTGRGSRPPSRFAGLSHGGRWAPSRGNRPRPLHRAAPDLSGPARAFRYPSVSEPPAAVRGAVSVLLPRSGRGLVRMERRLLCHKFEAPERKGLMSRSIRSRRLSVQPVALSLAVALILPTTAFAANTTTGYSQTPPTTPTTTGYSQTPPTPTTGTSPSAGTSPSKETSSPTAATAPTTTSAAPTTTTTSGAPTTTTTPAKSAKASTLPFTGLDLRWTVAIGLLLMGVGFSIVTVQRRQRRSTAR